MREKIYYIKNIIKEIKEEKLYKELPIELKEIKIFLGKNKETVIFIFSGKIKIIFDLYNEKIYIEGNEEIDFLLLGKFIEYLKMIIT